MHVIAAALGLDVPADQLGFAQVGLRAVIVFVVALATLRIAGKRALAQASAFDVVLGVVFGSVLSRAVNGSAAFLPTLFGGVVLVALHSAVSHASVRWRALSDVVKGNAEAVVRDGVVDEDALRRLAVTPNDLLEQLRLNGNVAEIGDVRLAMLERNGRISVVERDAPRERGP